MTSHGERLDSRTVSTVRTRDFDLSMDEIRAVTAFAAASADEVLPLFESERPTDSRPRDALAAAHEFARGLPRSRLQRISAPAAHRAAKEADSAVAFHAAMAAGDAAASAYLHPLADAVQVKHILRASAHTIRALELSASGPAASGPTANTAAQGRRAHDRLIEEIAASAPPTVVAVLCRYPRLEAGGNPLAQTLAEVDAVLRDEAGTAPDAAEGRR